MAQRPRKIKRPWVQLRKPFERQRHTTDFDYNGRRWRRVRALKLTQDPLCIDCEAKGIITPATVADHEPQAKVLIARGDDPYDMKWLYSRCASCHNAKSGRERHL